MKKTLAMVALALMLAGCSSQPQATEAQLSALFTEDSARWESFNAGYQDCVFEMVITKSNEGQACYTEAKELVAAAKAVLADYEALDVRSELEADGGKTITSLQSVVDGDITKACGNGALPDAELEACGDAVPGWVASLDGLVTALDRW